MTQFNSCFDTSRFGARVTEDETLGRQQGVSGTPTVFVNGTRVQNFTDFTEISGLIDAALAR